MSEQTYITNAGAKKHKAIVEAQVTIVDGPDGPREAVIPPAGLMIGSGADAGLQLNDKRVSRNHVHIMMDDGQFRVRDLGSTNGTFVDGKRVTDARVSPGTRIVVGKTTLSLDVPERPS